MQIKPFPAIPGQNWPTSPPPWEDPNVHVIIVIGMICTPVDETVALVWVCGKAVRVVRTVIVCRRTVKRIRVKYKGPKAPQRRDLCKAALGLCIADCGMRIGAPVSPDEPFPLPGTGNPTEAAKCAMCCNLTYKKCADGQMNSPWPKPQGNCSFPDPYLPDDIINLE